MSEMPPVIALFLALLPALGGLLLLALGVFSRPKPHRPWPWHPTARWIREIPLADRFGEHEIVALRERLAERRFRLEAGENWINPPPLYGEFPMRLDFRAPRGGIIVYGNSEAQVVALDQTLTVGDRHGVRRVF